MRDAVRALCLVGVPFCVFACGAQDPPPPQGAVNAESADGGAESGTGVGTDASSSADGPGFTGGGDAGAAEASCTESVLPPLPADIGTMAPEFAVSYRAHDLGPPPLPAGVTDVDTFDPLGGCVIARDDPNKLLFVANSERAAAAIYSVKVTRDACGHISGFDGSSTMVASLPNADANLIYSADGVLSVSQYPVAQISEFALDLSVLRTIDLVPLGLDGPAVRGSPLTESPGGIAFVPSYLGPKGELRAVGFPSGRWFHLAMTPETTGYSIASATSTVMLDNGPGAIAYVPPGSPGFDKPAVVTTEWFQGRDDGPAQLTPAMTDQRVVAYDVDDQGDPIVSTRREFFTSFDKPWGAYFEPVTGDFLFLSWLRKPDHIVVVRGFKPPPPPPPPPK